MPSRDEIEAAAKVRERVAAERNKAQYPVECERLRGFPDGFTIPDEAVEAGRDAMAYMYPGKVDGILVEEILQAAAPIIRADERERVKARVEALAIFAADNGIPFNLADYYEAIEGTDDE